MSRCMVPAGGSVLGGGRRAFLTVAKPLKEKMEYFKRGGNTSPIGAVFRTTEEIGEGGCMMQKDFH